MQPARVHFAQLFKQASALLHVQALRESPRKGCELHHMVTEESASEATNLELYASRIFERAHQKGSGPTDHKVPYDLRD